MRCTLQTTNMPSWWRKAAIGLLAASLLGCATPPGDLGRAEGALPVAESTANPAVVPSPPQAVAPHARTEVPAEPTTAATATATDGSWVQRGRTSWYGKQFNGRRTANGERFNAMAMTAAHRTLPFNSYLRVRVVGSGKEVVVRINDRGPFHKGRVLDVSYAAARQLGIVARGSALVDIAPVAADDAPATVELGRGALPVAP